MKMELEKWNEARKKIETQLKELKRSIRRGGEREYIAFNAEKRAYEPKMMVFGPGQGTYKDYGRLQSLKQEATRLYAIRAFSRGRVHADCDLKGFDNALEEFALPVAA